MLTTFSRLALAPVVRTALFKPSFQPMTAVKSFSTTKDDHGWMTFDFTGDSRLPSGTPVTGRCADGSRCIHCKDDTMTLIVPTNVPGANPNGWPILQITIGAQTTSATFSFKAPETKDPTTFSVNQFLPMIVNDAAVTKTGTADKASDEDDTPPLTTTKSKKNSKNGKKGAKIVVNGEQRGD